MYLRVLDKSHGGYQPRPSQNTKDEWSDKGCVDYTSGDQWGEDLIVEDDKMHCPPAGADFVVWTYVNKPMAKFCDFLKTAMYNDIPITILGWRPDEPKRWHQYYTGSKIVVPLYYAKHCKMTDSTTIIFQDSTDVLFQADYLSIKKDVAKALSPKASGGLFSKATSKKDASEILFSSEAYCYPCDPAKPDEKKHIDQYNSMAPAGSLFKYLNSGGWAGHAGAVIKMLEGCLLKYDRPDRPVEELSRLSTHYRGDVPHVLKV
jgi:hypothetical protein